VSRHQEFAKAHHSRLTSQVQRRAGAYICQTPIYVRMACESMRSHRILHLHTQDTPECESADKCLVAIALTDLISLENAHAKRPSCCSQNIPPTQAHPPRRQHNCPSILTIDSGTLRTPSASRSLVTNRPNFSIPCTFGPLTSLCPVHLFPSLSFLSPIYELIAFWQDTRMYSLHQFSGANYDDAVYGKTGTIVFLSAGQLGQIVVSAAMNSRISSSCKKRGYRVSIMNTGVRWRFAGGMFA
jgi:hypothetical protein